MKHEKKQSLIGPLRLWALYLLGGVVFVTSCSKEGPEDTAPVKEIVVRASVPSASLTTSTSGCTKAVAEESSALSLYFVRSDETSSGTWGAYGAESLLAERSSGSGVQPLTFSTPQYYRTDGLGTRLAGWYPGGAPSSGEESGAGYWDPTSGTVVWTIDGSVDILTAPMQTGSKTSDMGPFVFEHRLSQLQFYLYAESEKAASRWGRLVSVSVEGQRSRATLSLSDVTEKSAPVSFSGEAASEFAVRDLSALSAPVSKEQAVRAGLPVMIEPQASPVQLTLAVETQEGGSDRVVLPQQVYPAGTVVRVYLKLGVEEILVEPELSIDSWVPGSSHEVGTGSFAEPSLTVSGWDSGTETEVTY